MTLPVFVVDPDALLAEHITLDGDEGRHAVVVKRIRVGETIMLTDGGGQGAECVVSSVSKSALEAEVRARRVEPVAVPRLVVVQAIPKGDHAERAVDLLTEVGVDLIVPWSAERNVVSWKGERGQKALQRWRLTAKAAAKQSRRLRFPEVGELHATEDVVRLVEQAAAAFVLHEGAEQSLLSRFVRPAEAERTRAQADESGRVGGDVVLVVGPEGGITDDEVRRLAAAGGKAVRLGPSVLRSSTAGAVAAAVVLSRTSRWS
jgi:16S rRNA (uracil1498-N3)-methyltransferase